MLLLWLLCVPRASRADQCTHSSRTVSPVLESLQCYNDYQSYFYCKWKEDPAHQTNGTLKLWLGEKYGRTGLCEEHASDEEGFSQCRYKTKLFTLGTIYTAFFKETVGLCSSEQTTLDLSVVLRSRPPVNLTTSSTEDGLVITWSSPYPQTISLHDDITYQLGYRPHDHDDWTSEELSANQKQLDTKRLIPGRRYEARVRARVTAGQWSDWSASVSWQTQPDVTTAPPVDCVLWGGREVQCRWEQSIEQVHFITYQLFCGPAHPAPLEVCCEEPAVALEHREGSVTFTCPLRLTQPLTTSSLQVKLVPTRSVKTFRSNQNIRLNPPTHVHVKESGKNWHVQWTPPKTEMLEFVYQICYYTQKTEKVNNVCSDSQLLNQSSKGSPSVTITGGSLLPSHRYRVKVRSRVPSAFQGTPSDWSAPAEWTSHAEVRPGVHWIYALVGALVAGVFLALFIIPACRRKTLLWEESVPSPGKSKVILDIQQVVNNPKVMLRENTFLCKVVEVSSMSTCSSAVSLWSTASPEPEEDEPADPGIWSCENLSVPLDRSSTSFSGPYILCQAVQSNTVEDISKRSEKICPDVGRPATETTVWSEQGYVCLPSHSVSRSVQDLTRCTEEGVRLPV